jgi:hypothetical protein
MEHQMNFDILGTYLVYSVVATPVVGTACCMVVMLAEFVDGRMTRRGEAKARAAELAISQAASAAIADFQASTLSEPSPVELRVKRARRELRSAVSEPLNLAA